METETPKDIADWVKYMVDCSPEFRDKLLEKINGIHQKAQDYKELWEQSVIELGKKIKALETENGNLNMLIDCDKNMPPLRETKPLEFTDEMLQGSEDKKVEIINRLCIPKGNIVTLITINETKKCMEEYSRDCQRALMHVISTYKSTKLELFMKDYDIAGLRAIVDHYQKNEKENAEYKALLAKAELTVSFPIAYAFEGRIYSKDQLAGRTFSEESKPTAIYHSVFMDIMVKTLTDLRERLYNPLSLNTQMEVGNLDDLLKSLNYGKRKDI